MAGFRRVLTCKTWAHARQAGMGPKQFEFVGCKEAGSLSHVRNRTFIDRPPLSLNCKRWPKRKSELKSLRTVRCWMTMDLRERGSRVCLTRMSRVRFTHSAPACESCTIQFQPKTRMRIPQPERVSEGLRISAKTPRLRIRVGIFFANAKPDFIPGRFLRGSS